MKIYRYTHGYVSPLYWKIFTFYSVWGNMFVGPLLCSLWSTNSFLPSLGCSNKRLRSCSCNSLSAQTCCWAWVREQLRIRPQKLLGDTTLLPVQNYTGTIKITELIHWRESDSTTNGRLKSCTVSKASHDSALPKQILNSGLYGFVIS